MLDRQPAQSIVAAQRNDGDIGFGLRYRGYDAGRAAATGLSGDALIDNGIIQRVFAYSFLQQTHPAFLLVESVGGGQAVTKHQDHAGGKGVAWCQGKCQGKYQTQRGEAGGGQTSAEAKF